LLMLSSLAWGEPVHVGSSSGIEVQAEFVGGIEKNGEYEFPKGKPVSYSIIVHNRGGRSFAKVEAQASLISDGAGCTNPSEANGLKLPGASISASHSFPLSTGQSYDFNASYDVPSTLCTKSASLQVRLQYSVQNQIQAATLTCPVHLHFN
jgi:hypothetical protein